MDIYTEIILDYFKNPRNKGKLEDADLDAVEHNPICGDIIKIYLKTKDGKVEKATFEGQGCAISQASTSMLTEKLIGKTLEEVRELNNEEVYKMLGVEISPARVKCALLGLVCAKSASNNQKENA